MSSDVDVTYRLGLRRFSHSHLKKRPNQVDAGAPRVGWFHQPGIDVNELRSVGSEDDVGGQCTVPAQMSTEASEVET
jgi:hypothetical protein